MDYSAAQKQIGRNRSEDLEWINAAQERFDFPVVRKLPRREAE
jgi:hypothetical protein